MRQFLNTLFVLSEDAYLTLDGENVVVSRGKTEVGRVPLHTLESILCFSYAGASPALMGKCGLIDTAPQPAVPGCQPRADGQMRAYGH